MVLKNGPCIQEGESEELSDFKKQMLALMLALHERVERSEAVQDQQDLAVQVSRRLLAFPKAMLSTPPACLPLFPSSTPNLFPSCQAAVACPPLLSSSKPMQSFLPRIERHK